MPQNGPGRAQLPLSAAGAPLRGENLNDTLLWKPDLDVWETGPGGGGGGAFENLSNVCFIDGGTTIAEDEQTGNIERPFETIEQGITAGYRIFYCTPYAYGSWTGTPGDGSNIELHLLGGLGFGAQLPAIEIGAADQLFLYGDWNTSTIEFDTGAQLWVMPDAAANIGACNGGVTNHITLKGPDYLGQCTIGVITDVGAVHATFWAFTDDITILGDVEMYGCDVGGTVTAGNVNTDLFTINRIRENGDVVITGDDGDLFVDDAPSVKTVFTSRTIAEGPNLFITAMSNTEPGDTFSGSITWQDFGDAAVVNSLIGVPQCQTAGQVVVNILSPVDSGVSNDFTVIITKFPVGNLPIPEDVPPP